MKRYTRLATHSINFAWGVLLLLSTAHCNFKFRVPSSANSITGVWKLSPREGIRRHASAPGKIIYFSARSGADAPYYSIQQAVRHIKGANSRASRTKIHICAKYARQILLRESEHDAGTIREQILYFNHKRRHINISFQIFYSSIRFYSTLLKCVFCAFHFQWLILWL
jgi:hypothetical protein